ncbi:MAG: hypothetical protein HQL13_00940 [Candidatus Omnitrophica bacterium]|nr:hypothetical protein [Candidatus Omnitrophota bacterium]
MKYHIKSLARKILCVLLSGSLLLSPRQAFAQNLFLNALPSVGSQVYLSSDFVPVLLKGMITFPDKPFDFDFILDSGSTRVYQSTIKEEGRRMVRYFLAALTVKASDLWVNLSPYEHNRVIPNELGNTDLGRDMLAQDYLLKQLTASLIYPEKALGKEFWDKIYEEASKRFGTHDIPLNCFNKVWIVPAQAKIYEKGHAVYVTEARLKVMLEEDYLAFSHHKNNIHHSTSQLIRQIILPAIEHEVNEGKNFSHLRQIYYAAILAKWYRDVITKTLLAKVYVGKGKIKGVDIEDKTIKEQIYERYIKAYQKGVFNYIKEDINKTNGLRIPRKYFSGGISGFEKITLDREDGAMAVPEKESFGMKVRLVSPAQESQGPQYQTINPGDLILIQGTPWKIKSELPSEKEGPLAGLAVYEVERNGVVMTYRSRRSGIIKVPIDSSETNEIPQEEVLHQEERNKIKRNVDISIRNALRLAYTVPGTAKIELTEWLEKDLLMAGYLKPGCLLPNGRKLLSQEYMEVGQGLTNAHVIIEHTIGGSGVVETSDIFDALRSLQGRSAGIMVFEQLISQGYMVRVGGQVFVDPGLIDEDKIEEIVKDKQVFKALLEVLRNPHHIERTIVGVKNGHQTGQSQWLWNPIKGKFDLLSIEGIDSRPIPDIDIQVPHVPMPDKKAQSQVKIPERQKEVVLADKTLERGRTKKGKKARRLKSSQRSIETAVPGFVKFSDDDELEAGDEVLIGQRYGKIIEVIEQNPDYPDLGQGYRVKFKGGGEVTYYGNFQIKCVKHKNSEKQRQKRSPQQDAPVNPPNQKEAGTSENIKNEVPEIRSGGLEEQEEQARPEVLSTEEKDGQSDVVSSQDKKEAVKEQRIKTISELFENGYQTAAGVSIDLVEADLEILIPLPNKTSLQIKELYSDVGNVFIPSRAIVTDLGGVPIIVFLGFLDGGFHSCAYRWDNNIERFVHKQQADKITVIEKETPMSLEDEFKTAYREVGLRTFRVKDRVSPVSLLKGCMPDMPLPDGSLWTKEETSRDMKVGEGLDDMEVVIDNAGNGRITMTVYGLIGQERASLSQWLWNKGQGQFQYQEIETKFRNAYLKKGSCRFRIGQWIGESSLKQGFIKPATPLPNGNLWYRTKTTNSMQVGCDLEDVEVVIDNNGNGRIEMTIIGFKGSKVHAQSKWLWLKRAGRFKYQKDKKQVQIERAILRAYKGFTQQWFKLDERVPLSYLKKGDVLGIPLPNGQMMPRTYVKAGDNLQEGVMGIVNNNGQIEMTFVNYRDGKEVMRSVWFWDNTKKQLVYQPKDEEKSRIQKDMLEAYQSSTQVWFRLDKFVPLSYLEKGDVLGLPLPNGQMMPRMYVKAGDHLQEGQIGIVNNNGQMEITFVKYRKGKEVMRSVWFWDKQKEQLIYQITDDQKLCEKIAQEFREGYKDPKGRWIKFDSWLTKSNLNRGYMRGIVPLPNDVDNTKIWKQKDGYMEVGGGLQRAEAFVRSQEGGPLVIFYGYPRYDSTIVKTCAFRWDSKKGKFVSVEKYQLQWNVDRRKWEEQCHLIRDAQTGQWVDLNGRKIDGNKRLPSRKLGVKLKSSAMASPGGIDLSPRMIDLNRMAAQAQSGFDAAMIQRYQNYPGFTPVIDTIYRIQNIRRFLSVI